ncbi:MAG: DNA topoisomerase IV subunit A [Desulfomonile tiedjei]|nr:DNA topoisomerase IV subunit A [Desulfomonile tiedjei]
MEGSRADKTGGEIHSHIHDEVQKRYLAYALSTIVSRALPDVRDGLKPVHRRILYAMHGMRLGDAAKMRKSAAVVGEVIGKYHPHGDQAAYDALVRMAQDFSLRYPLIDGSGNFGSVDGDSPAAMRYTETRLSTFAGLLLREIEQGTTEFHPTYDGIGEEPAILPASVPNLLLNGSSGIAVGMSCSFAPHNLGEVIAACRAAIRDEGLQTKGLLKYIKGPDFPTGAEILDSPDHLAEIYASGHGTVRVRGTFEVETAGRGRTNLIVTSIPYSVNKSRLIERIAGLIKDKRLIHVQDVRDESTSDVRIVLELRAGDVVPDSVMAFLYKHTELQINFPMNFIAITPQGVPDRLSLEKIIRYFLDFRFEKTTLRLQHRLDILQQRIHVLEGFGKLFQDLDAALKIIRSARSRKEAEQGLIARFELSDQQVEAILEMRLYKLVGMEIGKVLDELAAKKKEARDISTDLADPARVWKIIDDELAEIASKFGDPRRTRIVAEKDASAIEYDPDHFVEHEDTTVILSKHGWVRRIKSEVGDDASLKFREGDGLFGWVRVNTGNTVAFFSNLGKVYVMRALDVPATTGFGEPIGSLLNLADGEFMVGFIAPDPAEGTEPKTETEELPDQTEAINMVRDPQYTIFEVASPEASDAGKDVLSVASGGILVTRKGQGFRFDYDILRETSKRIGRKLVNLKGDDQILTVRPEDGEFIAAASNTGKILVFPVEQVPLLTGVGQGVRFIKLPAGSEVVALEVVNRQDELRIQPKKGKEATLVVGEIPTANRATQGKTYYSGILAMERVSAPEGQTR